MRIVKIKPSSESVPCKTRLTETEGMALLRGKSVLITSGHRLSGGKLKKDQEFVDLYLPRMDVESCKKQGNDWVVKVKFADPEDVAEYLNNPDIRGGSFFRRLWRGLKKAGRFIYNVGKKVAPDVLKAIQPTVGQLFDQVANIPGVKSAYEGAKSAVGLIPGASKVVDAVEGTVKSDVLGRGAYEGGVGRRLGGAMSEKKAAERRASAVCEMLHPLLVAHFMEGGRLIAV